MAFVKKITKTYGVLTLVIGGVILTILGLIFNLLFGLVFTGLGWMVPSAAPLLAMVSLIVSFYISAVIAIFVVLGWLNKNKRLGGF
jgi:hypothetical protein